MTLRRIWRLDCHVEHRSSFGFPRFFLALGKKLSSNPPLHRFLCRVVLRMDAKRFNHALKLSQWCPTKTLPHSQHKIIVVLRVGRLPFEAGTHIQMTRVLHRGAMRLRAPPSPAHPLRRSALERQSSRRKKRWKVRRRSPHICSPAEVNRMAPMLPTPCPKAAMACIGTFN